ncbi:protein of unknown function [uncultured Sphingopyxis sp.]|uniref:Ester cyclase n=1 Tax=uncultured Sphingopyxis sp. TaxID=310581 RepID=A0A1Y5PRF4_9SPHN|nr:protein of unknown function [uncultured Sphingopyxis sp.]
MIRDSNKVVVRSTITGTQKAAWLGPPATGRTMRIQAVDIHEFEGGQVVRTWHTEDWMTASPLFAIPNYADFSATVPQDHGPPLAPASGLPTATG